MTGSDTNRPAGRKLVGEATSRLRSSSKTSWAEIVDPDGEAPAQDGDTAPQLRLRLIGQFQLADAVGAQVVVRSRRARALLAYIFLQQRQSETRGRLSGLFWSDRAEAQARASLRQCLTELRAALPQGARDALQIGRDAVALAPGALRSDTLDLMEALSRGRIGDAVDLLREAQASPLLEELDLPGPFSQWLEQTRTHFDRQLAQGVHRLLKTEEAAGMWPEVRELAEVYLRRDLVDEVVAATLMRAEVALGDASAARRRFQSLRTALEQAFGVEPGEGPHAALRFAAAPADQPVVANTAKPAETSGPPLVVVALMEGQAHENRHLAAAITDEVIAGLSGFREFHVTPASLSLADLDKAAWVRRGAAYFLGGRLQRCANGVRLTAQLVRASDNHVIWSARIETPAAAVYDIIEQIAVQMVGAVSPTIDQDLERRVVPHLGGAYERYVSARSAAHGVITYEEARETAAALEAMVAEDPDFILPYLPLAKLYNTDFCFTRAGSSGPAERDRAFSLAKVALSKDRGHIYAYTVVGWGHLWRREWAAARTHFDQAMALNPFHPDRVMEAGFGYLCLGDLEKARMLLERCLVLNPTPKDSYYVDLGLLELVCGDFEGAARRLELVAKPTTWALLYRALSTTLVARPDPALKAAVLDSVASVWPLEQPMTKEAIARWVLSHHPFAQAQTSDWFLESIGRTLA